jgi:4-oxalocrotonate tautomerase
MPLIEVKWFKGRDNETKAKTIRLLTEAMCEAVGCGPDAVTVIIQDVERYEWGKAGKPYA